MSPEEADLNAPKSDPISLKQLSKYDGVQDKKIYLAIKGDVFDVTSNTKSYGPGGGYHPLVGKDSSRSLGLMSLSPDTTNAPNCWDYSGLTEKQLKTVNDWHTFFTKRYNIVGKVSDLPK